MSRLWTEVKSIAHFQASSNFTPNFRYELLKTLLWLLNVEQRYSFTLMWLRVKLD